MLNTNSDILRRVVQADFNLQPRSSACRTAQVPAGKAAQAAQAAQVPAGKIKK